MNRDSKIYIAGHQGMVGSAITRKLLSSGYKNLVFSPRSKFDLTDQKTVIDFFYKEKPDYVFLAAARVGGIIANNTYRAQFIYDNLMIQNNIIHQSYDSGVKKLLFLGSSCIYPKDAPQPLKEEYLLTDRLEYTNEPYAIAKIAGINMCESYNLQYGTNFISVMPTNLFGPNDNYDLITSHVLPAMIRKFHLAKCVENGDWEALRYDLKRHPVGILNEKSSSADILESLPKYGIEFNSQRGSVKKGHVTIRFWGTGDPYREFMHVDDAANACIFIMNNIDFSDLIPASGEVRNTQINIGTGKDITLRELASQIGQIIGFAGEIAWDNSRPDGTMRKLLDITKIKNLGWKPEIDLFEGIEQVYKEYREELINKTA